MFRKTALLSGCLVVAVLMIGSSNAQAASVYANAWLGQLEVALEDGMGLAWSFKNNNVQVSLGEGMSQNDSNDSSNDWTAAIDVEDSIPPNASARASADANVITADVALQSNLEGSFYAYVGASQGGNFTVSGSGWVTFTLAYGLSLDNLVDASFEDWASGSSSVSLSLDNQSSAEKMFVFKNLNNYLGGGWEGPGDSGADIFSASIDPSSIRYRPLSISMYFADGEQGSFSGSASASGDVNSPAAVPEPASMLLLGAGLAGLVGLRRR